MVTSGASCGCDSCLPDVEAEFALWRRIAREGHLEARRAVRAENLALQAPRHRRDTTLDLDCADAFDPSGGLRRALAGMSWDSLGARPSLRARSAAPPPPPEDGPQPIEWPDRFWEVADPPRWVLNRPRGIDPWVPPREPPETSDPGIPPGLDVPGDDYTPCGGAFLPLNTSPCPLPPDPFPELKDSGLVIDEHDSSRPGVFHKVLSAPASIEARPWLVVALHGAGDQPDNMAVPAGAASLSGFRTIALAWNGPEDGEEWHAKTARDYCKNVLGVSEPELSPCLEETRDTKLHHPIYGIEPQLLELLLTLDLERPGDGWDTFLCQEGGVRVAWERIILVGYSEGANQSAYMLRRLPVRGAVLISGGGDLGTLEGLDDTILADWMFEPILLDDVDLVGFSDRVLGLHHVDETHSYGAGWTYDGVRLAIPEGDPLATPVYDAFDDKHRLMRTDAATPAHGSTVQLDMGPAIAYLICKAAGVEIP